MANKLIKRRYNNLLTARRNYYAYAGPIVKSPVPPIDSSLGGAQNPGSNPTPSYTKPTASGGGRFLGLDWGNPFKGANGAAAKNALTSAAGAAVGQIGGGLIGGGLQSGAGSALQGLSGMAAAIPGPWGAAASAGLGLIGGLTNRMFGSKMNTENIAKVEANINNLKNFQSNASDFDTLSQNWANADTGMTFSDSFIGKDGWFSNKAKNKAADLRNQIEAGNAWVQSSLNNNAENIGTTQMQNLLANYTAYGGPLYFAGGGDIASRHQGSTIDFENSRFARFFRSLFSSNKGKFGRGKTGGGGSRNTPGHVTKYKEEKDTTIIPLPVVQTFNEAFAKARKGEGKTFQFNGKTYSTTLGGGEGTYEAGQRRKAVIGVVPDTIIDTRLVPYTENTWALGGSLFADGGSIHIDPANRGKFTETKRRTGKTTEELTHSKNPLTRKRTIFAQNAKKWHHAFGGDLMTHGANFDTGLTLIGNGGTHEENPNEGVPMGMDSEGIPNLVEEGEVIFNDYVFSKRLKVPKAVRKKYKLRGTKPLTFADAAIQMSKESEERPNDPISKAGLEDGMFKLMIAQEQIRAKRGDNKFAKGGKMGRIYAGEEGDPYSQILRLGKGPLNPTAMWTLEQPPKEEPSTPVEPPKNEMGIVLGGYTSNPTIIQPGESTIPEIIDLNRTKYSEKKDNVNNNPTLSPTWMRYTPAFASGIMSITDALGLTNKPDYGEAEAVLEAAKGAGTYNPVKFRPIGNYLTYRPFDRDFYTNKLNAESGAARRALLNTSGGNRAQALAGILAADYNAQGKMGDLFRQAEEYNLAQRQKVEEFNRATDKFNSEGIFKADQVNQSAQLQAKSSYLKGVLAAAELRQKERQAATVARSANLSNFINSLGDIGKENFSRNMITSDPSKYYWIGSNGAVHYKGAYDSLSADEKKEVDKEIASKTRSNANGGYLTIKKRKRR